MKIEYLPIMIEDIDKKPDSFAITINKQDLIFEVYWNPEVEGENQLAGEKQGGFFFNLYDSSGAEILLGRRIVYGQDMLENVVDDRVEGIRIIPWDKTQESALRGVKFNNFMTAIKPYILVGDEDVSLW